MDCRHSLEAAEGGETPAGAAATSGATGHLIRVDEHLADAGHFAVVV